MQYNIVPFPRFFLSTFGNDSPKFLARVHVPRAGTSGHIIWTAFEMYSSFSTVFSKAKVEQRVLPTNTFML